MSEPVRTIQGVSTCEETIRKSRFVAFASRADTPEDAMAFLESVRDPEATHNCWAYKIGAQYRFSDDGEPGGTAGRPIFMAIDHQGMDRVIVVVTRFFGGIKLGAGGLARAYGGLAARCLQSATCHIIRKHVLCRMEVPFSRTGAAYHLLENSPGVEKLQETFQETGIVFSLRLTEDDFADFEKRVLEVGSGGILLAVTGEQEG